MYQGNISLRFYSNSEANASELLENRSQWKYFAKTTYPIKIYPGGPWYGSWCGPWCG